MLQCFHKHALEGKKAWTFKWELKWESKRKMAYKYPVDKLYGSVSQSLPNALLTYCPPAYSAAEIQQKGFTISAHSCYLRGPRWQVSIRCVSCSMLCLSTLFLYCRGLHYTVWKKLWDLQEENSIHTNFTFHQRNFKLLVMSFTSLPIAITSKIIIYQEKKNWGKNPQTKSVLLDSSHTNPAVCYYLPTSYFFFNLLRGLMASSALLPNAKGSRHTGTGKKKIPSPKSLH